MVPGRQPTHDGQDREDAQVELAGELDFGGMVQDPCRLGDDCRLTVGALDVDVLPGDVGLLHAGVLDRVCRHLVCRFGVWLFVAAAVIRLEYKNVK